MFCQELKILNSLLYDIFPFLTYNGVLIDQIANPLRQLSSQMCFMGLVSPSKNKSEWLDNLELGYDL
jgi:hypothetical protein